MENKRNTFDECNFCGGATKRLLNENGKVYYKCSFCGKEFDPDGHISEEDKRRMRAYKNLFREYCVGLEELLECKWLGDTRGSAGFDAGKRSLVDVYHNVYSSASDADLEALDAFMTDGETELFRKANTKAVDSYFTLRDGDMHAYVVELRKKLIG